MTIMTKPVIPIDSDLEKLLGELCQSDDFPGPHVEWDYYKIAIYMLYRSFHGRPKSRHIELLKPHSQPEYLLTHLEDQCPDLDCPW